MAAPIFGSLSTFFRMWLDDTVQTLIRRRRLYHPIFATTRIYKQTAYWIRISQDVMATHPGLSVTTDQCRNKWNSLKLGTRTQCGWIMETQKGFQLVPRACTMSGSSTNCRMNFGSLDVSNYLIFNWFFIKFIAFILINYSILSLRSDSPQKSC